MNTQDVERGFLYWTDVVLDGDKWQAVVKMVMNSRVLSITSYFFD